MAGPLLPDINTLIAAGFMRNAKVNKEVLQPAIKKILRIKDEQDACNVGKWYNIPCDLSSQELERMIYYKGQLIIFRLNDKFYFMPYALQGTIDFYGRYNKVHPVPMTSGATDKNNDVASRKLAAYLATIELEPVYGIKLPEELDLENLDKYCVILRDYTNQLSQTNIPRCDLNEPLLDVMAECIPFMRTNLLANSGITALRVNDESESGNVEDANRSIEFGARTGKPLIPIQGTLDFQDVTGKSTEKSEEFMVAMQSLDNFRLSTHGIQNGGLFSKKAHMLQDEQDMMSSSIDLTLQDKVMIRQNFCNIVNSIWGTNIWFEPSENETQVDINGDGVTYDRSEANENGGIETDDSDEE